MDIKSKECLDQIDVVANSILSERKHMIWEMSLGNRLKRDAIASLTERGMMDSTKIVDEYILIQKKVSKLPLRERELITGIVGMAIVKLKK